MTILYLKYNFNFYTDCVYRKGKDNTFYSGRNRLFQINGNCEINKF